MGVLCRAAYIENRGVFGQFQKLFYRYALHCHDLTDEKFGATYNETKQNPRTRRGPFS
jgi:hypothetical protein